MKSAETLAQEFETWACQDSSALVEFIREVQADALASRPDVAGWKLVPAVPDETMLAAGHSVKWDWSGSAFWNVGRIYTAMLAAAPSGKGEGS